MGRRKGPGLYGGFGNVMAAFFLAFFLLAVFIFLSGLTSPIGAQALASGALGIGLSTLAVVVLSWQVRWLRVFFSVLLGLFAAGGVGMVVASLVSLLVAEGLLRGLLWPGVGMVGLALVVPLLRSLINSLAGYT